MQTNRRELLAALATAVGSAACATTPGALLSDSCVDVDVDVDEAGSDLLEGDALDIAARVRSGEATPAERVEAAVARIEALNGPINAVVTKFYDRARAEAAGPLSPGPFAGVPYLLKDLNDLEGTPKSMGSRLFAGYISKANSPHTQAAVDAEFLILGKTNTPEFGLTATTESAALGVCRNPWNLEYSTGGSSGGAAAVVAAGIQPISQASDGGGSIRVPTSCCGVFGLKPGRGHNRAARSTRSGDISVKHCISRCVRDSAAYLTVVQRRDAEAPFEPMCDVEGPSSRRLRIAFYTKNLYTATKHIPMCSQPRKRPRRYAKNWDMRSSQSSWVSRGRTSPHIS